MELRRPDRSVGWVYAALFASACGFAIFRPNAFLIVDEERYVSQALAFAAGGTTVDGAGFLYPPARVQLVSDYPPATSLLQAPFVWAFGWRGAAVLSLLALGVATLATARWLRASGRAPVFALLVPGYVGTAFFARLGMSDVPGTALIAVASYLLWTARSAKDSFAAGLCVGASVLFREPLLVLLAPLAVGAIVRRGSVKWAIVAGVAAGLLLRALAYHALTGDPLHVRDSGYGFSLSNLRHTLPVYAALLLVAIPGGALLPFAYRGERRGELLAGAGMYVAVFVLYGYDVVRDNGALKGFILASRFMAPLTPLLAFMAAEVWSRWLDRIEQRWPRVNRALPLGATAAIAVAFAVHPLAAHQESVPRAVVSAIYRHTSANRPVITNSRVTLKYLSPAYGSRQLIQQYDLPMDSLASFTRHHHRLTIVLLDRTDSETFRKDAESNAEFLARARARCELRSIAAEQFASYLTLRVLDVVSCR